MNELGLICKQPGRHTYKQATVERLDIPNVLNRAFEPENANQVWCGDITYIWTGNRWHYLAAVLDLYARRVEENRKMFYSIVTRAVNMAHINIGSDCGAIALHKA